MRAPPLDVIVEELRRRLHDDGIDPDEPVTSPKVRLVEPLPIDAERKPADRLAELLAQMRRAASGYPPFA